MYISNQFEYFFFSSLERPVSVLVVGVGQPRVDDLVVVVHPLEVGLRALDGLLDLAFGGAQAILVIFLKPFQLKMNETNETNETNEMNLFFIANYLPKDCSKEDISYDESFLMQGFSTALPRAYEGCHQKN